MYILLIILTLLLEAFFSGAETALVSANRMRLRALMEKGSRSASIAYNLLQSPHKLLSTTLVGTNLCVVTESVLAASLCISVFGKRGPLIATLLIVPCAIIFGEMMPKMLFKIKANRLLLTVAPILLFFQKLLLPAVSVVGFLANTVIKGLGIKRKTTGPFLTKDEIKLLIQEIASEGVIREEEKETIGRVFKFGRIAAKDIMTPLDRVIGIDYNYTRDEIEKKARLYGYTRFPVFENKELKGIMNLFDLYYQEDDWHNHLRPVSRVDINERIDVLFSRMKVNKEIISAVVQTGRVVGIVTITDIMEEIVLPKS